MPNTMKATKTRRNKHCNDPSTMHGLKVWYEAMFEKLGWMVLANSKGYMKDKVESYKKSLLRLEDKIQCKINSIENMDKKTDLEIMHKNVQILIAHVMKDFK
jgi:hypothetical protein